MRKIVAILLMLTLLLPYTVWAEEPLLTLETPAETVRPGKALTIVFTSPAEGTAEILLKDAQGQTVSVVAEDFQAQAGENILWWNGTYQGVPAPVGEYYLTVLVNGQTASAPVTVGDHAPYITNLSLNTELVSPYTMVNVGYYAGVKGVLEIGLWQEQQHLTLDTLPVEAGQGAYTLDAGKAAGSMFRDGAASLTLMLTDETGFASNQEHLNVMLAGFDAQAEEAEIPEEEVPEEDVTAEDAPVQDEPATATDLPEEEAQEPAEEADELLTEDEDLTEDADAAEEVIEDEMLGMTEVEERAFTPAYTSPYQNDETMNYWTLPMDIKDEEKVWEMLMQPMVVIDGKEKNQTALREEPDENSKRVAVVTQETQGVHVLETLDNGWSLVECYSSSFHDSKVKAWNMLVQGYVPTSALKTVKPSQEWGVVIDKLTQKLYLFKEGKLFSTLDVSTGLANERQPYNETRSGEFFLTSAVGGFWSDNMFCPRAIRFNDGDLLHEVPYVSRNDNKIYSATEPYLGQKASHGCIRVQRKRTPEGVNMTWLWDNRKKNTKLVIWEDWQGRQIEYPADDLQLYYNADGGTYYHSQGKCYSAKDHIVFTAFPYSEMEEGDKAKLKRCPYCAPVLRRSEIDEINELYAPGGDHDPVMTAAREKYLNGEYDEK